MNTNLILLLILGFIMLLQTNSHAKPDRSIYGTKCTESFFGKIIIPNVEFKDESIEVAIEHLRWIVVDILTQQENFSDIIFINRSRTRGKKVTLEIKNANMNEILDQLAEINELEIKIEGSQIHFFDKPNK